MSDEGLFNMVMGAMANGPANTGERDDGKICTAQGGECRFNSKYYSPGMRDAKSWGMPHADNGCTERCPYLNDEARDMGSSEERKGRVFELIDGMGKKRLADDAYSVLVLASLGIDISGDDAP